MYECHMTSEVKSQSGGITSPDSSGDADYYFTFISHHTPIAAEDAVTWKSSGMLPETERSLLSLVLYSSLLCVSLFCLHTSLLPVKQLS